MEEEEEDVEEVAGNLLVPPPPDTPTSGKKPRKAKANKDDRVPHYHFTDEQEEELCEWYRDNSCLYNRRMSGYRERNRKERLYQEKAASYDPECSGKYY